jgi:hypothetical protein
MVAIAAVCFELGVPVWAEQMVVSPVRAKSTKVILSVYGCFIGFLQISLIECFRSFTNATDAAGVLLAARGCSSRVDGA